MSSDPLFIVAVLGLNVALSEWLARHTALSHFGAALLVIVITAITANLGIIPPYGGAPVYDGVFRYVAPLAIFLLLLRVNLRGVLRAGLPMTLLFLIGSAGTLLGVLAGMWVVGGSRVFGEMHFALGGMFVGTYTGGSVNFNAVALEYDVVKDGLLYAGATVVDAAMTTVWMAATVALPRLLRRFRPAGAAATKTSDGALAGMESMDDTETVHPLDVALLLALGGGAVWLSEPLAAWASELGGVKIPSILVLTTVALLLAQLPAIQRLRGTRLCGMLAVMIFLAVIGALCDVSALAGIGPLGGTLAIFATVVIAVHGLVVFGSAALLRQDPAVAAVASQANIGGGTTALALARSLGRGDLVLPGILVGALGNAIGTYLGFLAAAWLRG